MLREAQMKLYYVCKIEEAHRTRISSQDRSVIPVTSHRLEDRGSILCRGSLFAAMIGAVLDPTQTPIQRVPGEELFPGSKAAGT
jgi:hypothetical protein